jgi:tetratricopeptide (TPR) repeat protein
MVDTVESERLLALLDGLPLAIAQAGAYLQESGVGLTTYLRFYEQQWSELMESDNSTDAPLQDYPNRSVWTTWAISYQAIREKHEATANLLLLWSFLDNKDLWHGLFAAACGASDLASTMLVEWIGDIATSELKFSNAIILLRNYSLVVQIQETMSYTTHPVLHKWAFHSQGRKFASKLWTLAVVAVGHAVPLSSSKNSAIQSRLLPHAQACSEQIPGAAQELSGGDFWGMNPDERRSRQALLSGLHMLGVLYADQDRLVVAEQIYNRALQGTEKAVGPNHTSACDILNNLGALYNEQGRLVDAQQMYERALQGYEKSYGSKHMRTLQVLNNLSIVYKNQGKLETAKDMLEKVLRERQEVLGQNHVSTFETMHNLGNLCGIQGNFTKAEQMYDQALQGYESALGPKHTSTLRTMHSLGFLYKDQGKLAKAEQMYTQALQGYIEALGPHHTLTLRTMRCLESLYRDQGRSAEAEDMFARAR